eukprot:scaffold631841_cov110-Attheya_sp.AAC.1
MTIPAVKLCLLNCQAKYKDNGESAQVLLQQAESDIRDCKYHMGLGRLIGLCKEKDNQTDAKFIERLRLGLPTGKVVGEDGLDGIDGLDEEYMNCKGPGVMLLELSSHYKAAFEAASEADFFAHLVEMIELDMRGTLQLVDKHATISCGEAKSSKHQLQKAKLQLKVRILFLETVLRSIFPDKIEDFLKVGHIFFPDRVLRGQQEDQEDYVGEDGISFYIHYS